MAESDDTANSANDSRRRAIRNVWFSPAAQSILAGAVMLALGAGMTGTIMVNVNRDRLDSQKARIESLESWRHAYPSADSFEDLRTRVRRLEGPYFDKQGRSSDSSYVPMRRPVAPAAPQMYAHWTQGADERVVLVAAQ